MRKKRESKIEMKCYTCDEPVFIQPYRIKGRQKNFYCDKNCSLAKPKEVKGTAAKASYPCKGCTLEKPGDQFNWQIMSNGGKYKRTYCIECEIVRSKNYHSEHVEEGREQAVRWLKNKIDACDNDADAVRVYLKRRIAGYKKRAIKKGMGFDLDIDFLVSLFMEQNGKCFYSGREMVINNIGKGNVSRNADSVSLDRRDNGLGYIKGNVVFCTYAINTMKLYFSEEEFIKTCSMVISSRNNPNPT